MSNPTSRSKPASQSGQVFSRHTFPGAAFPRAASSDPPVTLQPSRATAQAVVTAAAMVACADGHVARSERRSLIRFLSCHGVLARYGRAELLAAFELAVREAAPLNLEKACTAADGLRSVAGRPGASLVALVATQVALADGVTWPQEIALLEVIRDRVGLAGPDLGTGQ
ncbi:MAG: tellurite resistance TerB family protein [Acetobacteraceae bacterium]|nr:tellurite resistance TerB family protein [Acetobacteraceae bacterium]